jgi:membrane-associated protease RseP (regulator of RpoE activity)
MLEGMSHTGMPDDMARARVESAPALPPMAEGTLRGETPSDANTGREPGPRELTADDLESPRGRRVFLPVALFVATCFSTFFVGAFNWDPAYYFEPALENGRGFAPNWENGLIYMAAVIGILLTHEMGHFLQTVRYHVPSSLPFFIPVPMIITGTMGAVIGMEGSRADRKQLFDIGLSGPIAGLIVALPIIWFGIQEAKVAPVAGDFQLGDPLIFKLMTAYLRHDIAPDAILNKENPLLMAGWVGMLITGLNMLPISQLDGGHVIYGLFGKRAHLVARAFLVAAIAFVVFGEHYNWTVMLVLVILLGVDHPPTRDDNVRLGPLRTVAGLLSLAIPVLCFTPVMIN